MANNLSVMNLLTRFITLSVIILFPHIVFCKSLHLKFRGDINFKTGKMFKGTQIGGLSALAFDKKNSLLYTLSDDRSMRHPARIYTFKLKLEKNLFALEPENTIFFKNSKGKNYPTGTVDFEGITLLNNGNFLISSEGNTRIFPTTPPSITEFSKQGTFIREIKIPKKIKSNTLYNAALESLSLSPDLNNLFTITESPLITDLTKKDKFLPLRLISFIKDKTLGFKPQKEYLYPIHKNSLNSKKFNGVSDILSLGNNQFLILERSYLKKKNINILNLYLTIIKKNTSDISHIPSLKKHSGKIIKLNKKLIASLGSFSSHFQFGHQYLDNIEGVTFGPQLKNGNQTLIFVSDNNFSHKQRTQFLAFEIIKKP